MWFGGKSLPNFPFLGLQPILCKEDLINELELKFFAFRVTVAGSFFKVIICGARTMEIGPIRNQNLIFWPLANVL